MSGLTAELAILLLLLLINGLFSMAEIALVTSRKARLKQLADKGQLSAKTTLVIAENPARFLSTVQVGITLIVILQGDLGGGALTAVLSPLVAQIGPLAPFADKIAKALVVVGITFASVVVGELIPKRLGLLNPERVAMALAPAIGLFSKIVSPVVGLLTLVSEGVLRLFGVKNDGAENTVTEEEIKILIDQGTRSGIFNKSEKDMLSGVLELDQMSVVELMTPRPKIVFLNLDEPEESNWRKIVSSGHSHFPVYQGGRDNIVGMVSVKALWAHSAIGLPTGLKNLLVPPLVVPETMPASQLLEAFKKSGKHIALIVDEFGMVQGLVSLIDVMEAIVGDIPTQGRKGMPDVKQREDGSWLVDATLATSELKDLLKLKTLPHEDDADFQTLGGFVMTHFGRIPAAGDYFEASGWRFEVVDMDRHRVDKVLIAARSASANEDEEKVAS